MMFGSLRRAWGFITCRPKPSLRKEGIDTWDAFRKDPTDEGALDRCIECWKAKLRKKKCKGCPQALEYLSNALLAKHRCHPEDLKPLQEAADIGSQLLNTDSRPLASDNMYRMAVDIADAFFIAFVRLENDHHLLERSIEFYQKAISFENPPGLTLPGKKKFCQVLLRGFPLKPDTSFFAQVAICVDDVRNTPTATHDDFVVAAMTCVRVYNHLRDIAFLDQAIEVLQQLSTSSQQDSDEKRRAEVYANIARLLLIKTPFLDDRGDATVHSDHLFSVADICINAMLAGARSRSPSILQHAQSTMVSTVSYHLESLKESITQADIDKMIMNLRATLAYPEVAHSPETLAALAAVIQRRCQEFREAPEITVGHALELYERALDRSQDQELRGYVLENRFDLTKKPLDLETASDSYRKAAENPTLSDNDREYFRNRASTLSNFAKASAQPDSANPMTPLTVSSKMRYKILSEDVVLV